MNKTIKTNKTTPKTRPTYKQTEAIRQPNAYYKSKEQWKAINDGQTLCPHCKQQVLEADAMETPQGETIHEACWEPGEGEH